MNVQSSASLKRLNHLQCEMGVVYHYTRFVTLTKKAVCFMISAA